MLGWGRERLLLPSAWDMSRLLTASGLLVVDVVCSHYMAFCSKTAFTILVYVSECLACTYASAPACVPGAHRGQTRA